MYYETLEMNFEVVFGNPSLNYFQFKQWSRICINSSLCFFPWADGWESASLSEEEEDNEDGEWIDVHHSSDEEQKEVVSYMCLLLQICILVISDQILLLCTLMQLLTNNYVGLWSSLTRISGVEVPFSSCAEVPTLLGKGERLETLSQG